MHFHRIFVLQNSCIQSIKIPANYGYKITNIIELQTCEPECPNNAIYEGGVEWAIADGYYRKGSFTMMDGSVVNADQRFDPVSVDTYYIVPNKCMYWCPGLAKNPNAQPFARLIAVFPMKYCRESGRWAMGKKEKLHV